MTAMTGKSVVVVGGGRGLGRGVALAARDAGARVTAVARDVSPLSGLDGLGSEQGDAADVRIAFTWLRAALRLPLAPGSRVVVFGSAAELRGSPLSGGYAGAKATVRLTTAYAAAQGLVAT